MHRIAMLKRSAQPFAYGWEYISRKYFMNKVSISASEMAQSWRSASRLMRFLAKNWPRVGVRNASNPCRAEKINHHEGLSTKRHVAAPISTYLLGASGPRLERRPAMWSCYSRCDGRAIGHLKAYTLPIPPLFRTANLANCSLSIALVFKLE
jgi:hypothetical protein